ncbi:MAG: MBL fold metallo-hydrolase [Actinobacteria bacterium]|nr:MBL fold metallo-hydrolase [Actinomycetota bacterium]
MFFQQYYLACLSHASYLVGDRTTGRAVVVDPQRDIAQYLADAEENGLRIEAVIETHFHADFLSGHLELADATGSEILYGEAAADIAEFPIRTLADGERLPLGEVVLEARATPGHTPESISIVVYERAEDTVPYGVLTGDTLFIGDVGRPDLLTSVGVTGDELARQLYRSLQDKLLPLPDETRVFPAHGAGSACGKNLSTETVSTMGEQRRTNYALQPMTEEAFVAAVTEGQRAAPLYFAFSAARNKQARPLLEEGDAPTPLPLEEVLRLQAGGALVLDTRPPADFALGHLRGSVNVGLEGRFAGYAGDVIRPDQSVILVGEDGTETEAKVRLARIGFDRVLGALAEPIESFVRNPDLVEQSARISAPELAARRRELQGLQVVDIRNEGEARLGMIPGAVVVPLARLLARLDELDRTAPTVVHCAGGYRSSIGTSVLRANGFTDVSDLLGGYAAWAAAELPTTTFTPDVG